MKQVIQVVYFFKARSLNKSIF